MTPTQRKAMEMALEKLKLVASGEDYGKLTLVIDVLSAALAEPDQSEGDLEMVAEPQLEPVAWMYFDSDGDAIFGHPNGYRPDDAVPVYTAPQPAKREPQALNRSKQ